jgi:hypothetical protein
MLILVSGILSPGNSYTKSKIMLRKRCKIKGYVFRRVEFLRSDTEDTVCEKQECKFCGPNFDDRYCEKIDLKKHTTLKDLCSWIDEETDCRGDFETAYIPDQDLYEIDYKIKKTCS